MTTEGGDPHHLSLPRLPRAQRHSRTAPALFGALAGRPPPAVGGALGPPLGRIPPETPSGREGGYAPLPQPPRAPTARGGTSGTPGRTPPSAGGLCRGARLPFARPRWRAKRGLGASPGPTPRESWTLGPAGDSRGVGREAKTCLEQVLPATEEPLGTDSRERLSGGLPKA